MVAAQWKNLAGEEGFSLVELIVVTTLTLVVLAAVYNIFISGMDNYKMIDEQNRAVRDTGKNMLLIGRYLRMSEGLDGPLGSGDPGDNAMATRVDLDNDTKYELVTFALDESSMELRATFEEDTGSTATQVYAEFVRNAQEGAPIFTYYDTNGAVITSASQRASKTAAIQIRLMVDVDTEARPPAFDSSTTVTLRNSQL